MAPRKSKNTELTSLMFAIGRSMRKGKDKHSFLHFEALRFVKDSGKPLMREVARHFNITPPAATLLVEGLVRDKLLARVTDRKDRRAIRVILTSAGRATLAKGIKEKITRLNKIFAALTEEEKDQMIALFKKMASKLRQLQ